MPAAQGRAVLVTTGLVWLVAVLVRAGTPVDAITRSRGQEEVTAGRPPVYGCALEEPAPPRAKGMAP